MWRRREVCRRGLGLGLGKVSSSPAQTPENPTTPHNLHPPPSASLRLLQLHLKVITRPSREQTSPIWSVYSGAEAGARGALLHLFGEERPEQTQLMKS